MTHAHLTTYCLVHRCTVRSAPGGQQIARLNVLTDTGDPREITGWEVQPGWIEWVRDGDVAGYLRASCVVPLAERTV